MGCPADRRSRDPVPSSTCRAPGAGADGPLRPGDATEGRVVLTLRKRLNDSGGYSFLLWLGTAALVAQWVAALLGSDDQYHWWVIPHEAIIVLNPLIFL